MRNIEIYEYIYGLVPVRRHKKRRIQKKWIKKYGFKFSVTGKKVVQVNPLKEHVFNTFKDLKPKHPEDEPWHFYGIIDESGNWVWDRSLVLGKMETLVTIRDKLIEETKMS